MPPGAPRQVSKSRFKAQAPELFRQVESSGEPLVVTDHGRPSLEVRPYSAGPAGRRPPGGAARLGAVL
jgi:antitoxin (DNA-binding transcriptional repressor) of toxin-antitoxin stability system